MKAYNTPNDILTIKSDEGEELVKITPEKTTISNLEGGGGGSGLPPVTSDDNGKMLQVKNGEWKNVNYPIVGETIYTNKLIQTEDDSYWETPFTVSFSPYWEATCDLTPVGGSVVPLQFNGDDLYYYEDETYNVRLFADIANVELLTSQENPIGEFTFVIKYFDETIDKNFQTATTTILQNKGLLPSETFLTDNWITLSSTDEQIIFSTGSAVDNFDYGALHVTVDGNDLIFTDEYGGSLGYYYADMTNMVLYCVYLDSHADYRFNVINQNNETVAGTYRVVITGNGIKPESVYITDITDDNGTLVSSISYNTLYNMLDNLKHPPVYARYEERLVPFQALGVNEIQFVDIGLRNFSIQNNTITVSPVKIIYYNTGTIEVTEVASPVFISFLTR